MRTRINIERVDEVPAQAHLCHYDELGERTKAQFPELACEADRTVDVDAAVARELDELEVVKFTDYYRVSR